MFKSQVGKEFKINFFAKKLNFCYDKENGFIYSDNIETLKKLKIDISLIEKINPETVKKEIIIENKISEETIKDFFEKNYKEKENKLNEEIKLLNNKQNDLQKILNNFLEFQKDQQELENENDKTLEILKNSIGILNKKIKENNEKNQNLTIKFEAVLEIMAELISKSKNNSDQFLDITKSNITLEKIKNSSKDEVTFGILTIALMVKRMMEEKGMRLS